MWHYVERVHEQLTGTPRPRHYCDTCTLVPESGSDPSARRGSRARPLVPLMPALTPNGTGRRARCEWNYESENKRS